MNPMITITKNALILIVLTFPIFYGCSKNSSPDSRPTPVDTLVGGWKKIAMPDLSFNDIFFINNNIGFAVGATDIFKSSDGGNNWQKVYHTANGFVNIAMGNESNAAFFTYGNKIIFTKDGGTSFDSVTINGDAIDGFFVNATTVFSIGKSFWKSINAGSTWTKLYDFASTGYKSLNFLNDQIGWVAGTGGVYKTINGGVSWELKTPGSDFDFSNGYGSVFFLDANNGYLSDGYRIGKTTNGGASWSRLFTGGPFTRTCILFQQQQDILPTQNISIKQQMAAQPGIKK